MFMISKRMFANFLKAFTNLKNVHDSKKCLSFENVPGFQINVCEVEILNEKKK